MTIKKRGLGRGLEALLVDVEVADVEGLQEEQSPTAEIVFKDKIDSTVDIAEVTRVDKKIPEPNKPIDEHYTISLIRSIQKENTSLIKEAENLRDLFEEFEKCVRDY